MIRLKIALFLLLPCFVEAQQYDAQWFIGPNAIMDFRNPDTVTNYTTGGQMSVFITNSSICDEEGNLLFFTNGIYIADRNGNILPNGDSLSPCRYTNYQRGDGMNIYQATLFLPKPGSNNLYLLFHFSNDTLGDSRPGTLYYSIVDKNGNNGVGAVVKKNIIFAKGTFRVGGMKACKHANGRDWWLVIGESNNNVFDKFLVTPDSVAGPFPQAIGPVYVAGDDLAYGRFSQDGSKFVAGAVSGYVLVMDFDRCSGDFSNPITIYNEASTDPVNHPVTGSVAQEFSPNNRFVYVSDNSNLNQYDLLSNNIQDSAEIYRADIGDLAHIDKIQLAPNGKIYGATWNGGYYFLHVINKPDEIGDSCSFIFGGQPTLSINSINLPNIANCKLGPLQGSGCDTIPLDVKQPQNNSVIRIQPNPANKYVYVEMPQQGNYELALLSATGQLIAKKQTPQIDIFDTENLPAGIYFILATDKRTGKQTVAQKVSVVH